MRCRKCAIACTFLYSPLCALHSCVCRSLGLREPLARLRATRERELAVGRCSQARACVLYTLQKRASGTRLSALLHLVSHPCATRSPWRSFSSSAAVAVVRMSSPPHTNVPALFGVGNPTSPPPAATLSPPSNGNGGAVFSTSRSHSFALNTPTSGGRDRSSSAATLPRDFSLLSQPGEGRERKNSASEATSPGGSINALTLRATFPHSPRARTLSATFGTAPEDAAKASSDSEKPHPSPRGSKDLAPILLMETPSSATAAPASGSAFAAKRQALAAKNERARTINFDAITPRTAGKGEKPPLPDWNFNSSAYVPAPPQKPVERHTSFLRKSTPSIVPPPTRDRAASHAAEHLHGGQHHSRAASSIVSGSKSRQSISHHTPHIGEDGEPQSPYPSVSPRLHTTHSAHSSRKSMFQTSASSAAAGVSASVSTAASSNSSSRSHSPDARVERRRESYMPHSSSKDNAARLQQLQYTDGSPTNSAGITSPPTFPSGPYNVSNYASARSLAQNGERENIQVVVRMRPLKQEEARQAGGKRSVRLSGTAVHAEWGKESKKFNYDTVFDPTCNQGDVYRGCAGALIDKALQGYNATVSGWM